MASKSALVAIVERMKERLVKENPSILKKPKAKRSTRTRAQQTTAISLPSPISSSLLLIFSFRVCGGTLGRGKGAQSLSAPLCYG